MSIGQPLPGMFSRMAMGHGAESRHWAKGSFTPQYLPFRLKIIDPRSRCSFGSRGRLRALLIADGANEFTVGDTTLPCLSTPMTLLLKYRLPG